jgi:hypothetical protein
LAQFCLRLSLALSENVNIALPLKIAEIGLPGYNIIDLRQKLLVWRTFKFTARQVSILIACTVSKH